MLIPASGTHGHPRSSMRLLRLRWDDKFSFFSSCRPTRAERKNRGGGGIGHGHPTPRKVTPYPSAMASHWPPRIVTLPCGESAGTPRWRTAPTLGTFCFNSGPYLVRLTESVAGDHPVTRMTKEQSLCQSGMGENALKTRMLSVRPSEFRRLAAGYAPFFGRMKAATVSGGRQRFDPSVCQTYNLGVVWTLVSFKRRRLRAEAAGCERSAA